MDLHILDRHVPDRLALQAHDAARQHITRLVLERRSLVIHPVVRLVDRNLRIEVADRDVLHPAGLVAPALTHVQIDRIGRIVGLQAVHQDVFGETAVYALDRDRRAEGIVNNIVQDLDVAETADAEGTELDAAGAGRDGVVPHDDIIVADILVVGFQADAVIGRIDETVLDHGVRAVHDIETVIVPEGAAVQGHAVDQQVFDPVRRAGPAG